MFEIMVEGSFAAAHRLLNYEGICEKQHGHNWKVQVYVQGDLLDSSGILIDFKTLNSVLQRVIDILDHSDLNNLEEFKNMSPSSELIAKYVYSEMKREINQITKVSVWETEKARATYWE